jgi:hypothetical protein
MHVDVINFADFAEIWTLLQPQLLPLITTPAIVALMVFVNVCR